MKDGGAILAVCLGELCGLASFIFRLKGEGYGISKERVSGDASLMLRTSCKNRYGVRHLQKKEDLRCLLQRVRDILQVTLEQKECEIWMG